MRKIGVTNNLTLDGVMQAPGGRDEDTRDGFKHGGWAASYNDEVKGREMAAGMAREGALLFGRRTYEQFFTVWQGRTDNPFSPVLDNTQKYVVSTTLKNRCRGRTPRCCRASMTLRLSKRSPGRIS